MNDNKKLENNETIQNINNTIETDDNNNLIDNELEKITNDENIIKVIEEKYNVIEEKYNVLNDKYIRIIAEYDNYRKRSLNERSLLYNNLTSEIIFNFLGIYDSILRAIESNKENTNIDIKGIELILKQFEKVLEKSNVEKIQTNINTKFDPNFHDAIMHINDSSYGENEIIEILNCGFKIGNKVIRHTKVKVAN